MRNTEYVLNKITDQQTYSSIYPNHTQGYSIPQELLLPFWRRKVSYENAL